MRMRLGFLVALVLLGRLAAPARAQRCTPLDTSTFAGLKAGGCLVGGVATDAAGAATPRAATGPRRPPCSPRRPRA